MISILKLSIYLVYDLFIINGVKHCFNLTRDARMIGNDVNIYIEISYETRNCEL